MFSFEADNVVILQEQKALEAALSTNPKTQKALQKLIREVVLEARRRVVNSIKFDNGDPRNTRQAVRTTVYRKILGGNLNLFQGKRRKDRHNNTYHAPKKLRPGQRGGNRMKRSRRTQQILSYSPIDREFIMRFVDSGTKQRFVGFRNERKANHNRYLQTKALWDAGENRTGNRGAIAARGFFARYGERAMELAADRLAGLIETELAATLNGMKK